MTRRLVVTAVAGVLGAGLAGCGGCNCPQAGAPAAQTPEQQICSGLSNLAGVFGAMPAIASNTPMDQVRKARDDIDREVPKVTARRGFYNETARTDLNGAQKDFALAVNSFGATTAVGSAAASLNEKYQGVKGSMLAVQYSMDCSTTPS